MMGALEIRQTLLSGTADAPSSQTAYIARFLPARATGAFDLLTQFVMLPMKIVFLFFVLSSGLSLFACTPKSKISVESLALSNASNRLIVPWYQQFATTSQSLYQHLERFCQNPGNQGELAASRKAWKVTMMAWQRAHIVNFGPVTDGNLSWRIQFWPDSHNRIGRKVDELLQKDQPITPDSLAQSVVLVQGLSAIEYLLFDHNAAQANRFQNPKTCEFLLAASDNTHQVAVEILRRWQPDGDNFISSFLSAGPNNTVFKTEQEAIAALVSAIVSNLEIVKGKKIADAFGGPPEAHKVNPYKLELWRSGASLEAMQQEILAVQQLFEIAIKPLLYHRQSSALADRIGKHLSQIKDLLAKQATPLFVTLRDPKTHDGWQSVWLELGQVLSLLKRDVPNALSLKLGFNSNDGD